MSDRLQLGQLRLDCDHAQLSCLVTTEAVMTYSLCAGSSGPHFSSVESLINSRATVLKGASFNIHLDISWDDSILPMDEKETLRREVMDSLQCAEVV